MTFSRCSRPARLRRRLTAAVWCGIFLTTSPLAAETLYVDGANGIDIDGCKIESSPCASIQYAVNTSVSGDTILVAAGTYIYDAGLDPCPSDHTAVICILNKNLTIRGGYGAGNWMVPDPETSISIVDGEDLNRGVLVSGSGIWAGLEMENFTIQRGLGLSRLNDSNGFGGGISCVLADVTLRNMLINNNTARGGDTATGEGGAGAGGGVAIRSNSSSPRATVVLENLILDGNSAFGGTGPVRGGYGEGGGIWINYSDATGNHLVLTNNLAAGGSSTGGGISNGKADALGGAVAFKRDSDSTFHQVLVKDNVALGGDANGTFGSAGGGYGGGLYGELATFISIIDGDVRQNSALGGDADTGGRGVGGGVFSIDSTVSLNRVQVVDNEARGGDGPTNKGGSGGGGVYFSDNEGANGGRSITMLNSTIVDNSVLLGSGGGSTPGGGGGVFLNGSQAEMVHCTVAGNGLYGYPLQGRAAVIITRNPTTTPVASELAFSFGLISDHTSADGDAAVHLKSGSSVTFDTGFFANNDSDTAGAGTWSGLDTMISVVSVGYFSPGSPDFDYRLLPTSQAVDAATGSIEPQDFEGESRDSSPDLGADEFSDGIYLIFADGFESGDTTAWQ